MFLRESSRNKAITAKSKSLRLTPQAFFVSWNMKNLLKFINKTWLYDLWLLFDADPDKIEQRNKEIDKKRLKESHKE